MSMQEKEELGELGGELVEKRKEQEKQEKQEKSVNSSDVEKKIEDLEHIDDAKLKDIVENKDVAAASYFLILSPILLFTRKDSEFIQYHSRQALALLLIFVFLWFLGTFFIVFAWMTIGVFFIALTAFIQAINGKYYEIPYIYEYVKDGYSFDLFRDLLKKSFTGAKKIILGLFPKNSFKKDEAISKSKDNTVEVNKEALIKSEETIKTLEKKIEDLEKKFEQINNK